MAKMVDRQHLRTIMETIRDWGYDEFWRQVNTELPKYGINPVPIPEQGPQPGGVKTPDVKSPGGSPGPTGDIPAGDAQRPATTPPTTTQPPPTASEPPPGTPITTDAYLIMRDMLASYGLESMADWLYNQFRANMPQPQIMIELRKQPAYLKRFPGMAALRQAGLPAISESQYLQIETSFKAILRQAGVTPDKYDDPNDFIDYFKGNITPDELNERKDLWLAMQNAPQVTGRAKQLFRQYAGIENVDNTSLFKMVMGADATMLDAYQKRTGQVFNANTIQNSLKKAILEEASTFRSGGGSVAETQQGRVGLTTIAEERGF